MKKTSLLLSTVRVLLTLAVLLILLVTGCSGGLSSFQPVVPSPTRAEIVVTATATSEALPLTISGCLNSDNCSTARLISSYFPEDQTRYYNTEYPVDIFYGDEVRFFYGWCAIDRPTLDENRAHMEYIFMIDGVSYIDRIDRGFTSMPYENDPTLSYPCYSIAGVLSGWKAGESHQVVIGAKFLQDIYDGWTTYTAGDYLSIFLINP